MSKKSNAEKQKRRHLRKPRKHQYKGHGRKNPAFVWITPPSGNLFDDPIFLSGIAQTILRALQFTKPEVFDATVNPEETIQ